MQQSFAVAGSFQCESNIDYFLTTFFHSSIAGLWVARICADHFEEVTIVEPEGWLGTEEGSSPVYDKNGDYVESSRVHGRSRVEQYTAAHSEQTVFSVSASSDETLLVEVFQPLALQALKKLFPGFEEKVKEFNGRFVGLAKPAAGRLLTTSTLPKASRQPNSTCTPTADTSCASRYIYTLTAE